jgi:hypothetical protein
MIFMFTTRQVVVNYPEIYRMSDDDQGGEFTPHPFAILEPLPVMFGYPPNFINGRLKWNLPRDGSGGGRGLNSDVIGISQQLAAFARDGTNLETCQVALKSVFMKHYGAGQIDYYYHFMLEDEAKSTGALSKERGVDALVRANAPFIPCAAFLQHLKNGEKYKGKELYPPLDWDPAYQAFCDANQPEDQDDEEREVPSEKEKMEAAVEFWRKAGASHNENVGRSKHVNFSKKELANIAPSQYSNSAGGTPTFHKSARETELKQKLMQVSGEYKKRAARLDEARERERRDQERRESSSIASNDRASSQAGKRKWQRRGSDSDSDADQGSSALDTFLSIFMRKINRAEYIDFASISTSRLAEIKMLNATSTKTSRIAAGLVVCTSLSEADVKILSEDLTEIFDGFFYHYLEMINESRLDSPVKTMIDRIKWWQWIATNFAGNPAANVLFIKKFMVEHHMVEFWEPIVKQCHSMVTLCKEKCASSHSARALQPPRQAGKTPTTSGGKGGGSKKAASFIPYTPAQNAKLASWRARFQGVCVSRMVRERNCPKEVLNLPCRFSHVCAWCSSAGCKAVCAKAEQL